MKRLALFAHYDARGKVTRFIEHFLRNLRTEVDRIVFVSTGKLDAREIEKLKPYCSDVFLRENVGYDFGMWKHAMEHVEPSEWDEIVLTNSSVFGPVRPLTPVFHEMTEAPCDVWGMTDNIEIAWHLQSYFLVFKRAVIASPAFRQFWASILPYKQKSQVIRSYEVGLSTLLVDQGFRVEPFARMSELPVSLWSRALRRNKNPTCASPLALLRAGMPFVKVELLRDNVLATPLAPVLREMEASGYDMSMIEFDRPISPWGLSPSVRARLAAG